MVFMLTVDCDNDAFIDLPQELSSVLLRLASKADNITPGASGVVADTNGNSVGTWTLTDDKETTS